MTDPPATQAAPNPAATANEPSLGDAPARLRDLIDPIEYARARAGVLSNLFGDKPEPVTLGRFIVLRRIGAGGMGVVYLARDPELEREVAVKLVHCGGARDDPTAIAVLLAEARAMARLTHPNVVFVHEVGVADGGMFIVMEYVPGGNVRAWLRERPRAVEAVLPVFLAAGQGLAAAHRAGLAHHDFKPDNILIDADGRVRVADFGLARIVEGGGRSGASEALGTVRGTPAYMAPEQHLGRPSDARADQFAFCVALHEALYGRRPWDEVPPQHQVEAMLQRDLTALPRRPKVPPRVQRALLRGLARDPARRHPTMHALLAALQEPAGARRRPLALAALAGAALVGVMWSGGGGEAPCAAAAHALDEVWSAADGPAIERRLASDAASAISWGHVVARLDAYASAWTAMRGEACESGLVRREQSAELLDRRMACLDDARRQLAATSEFLRAAEPADIGHATALADGLPRLERCVDSEALRTGAARSHDPGTRVRSEAIATQLTRAQVALAVGRHRGLRGPLLRLQAEVDALGDAALAGRYWRLQAHFENAEGKLADETAALDRALAASWEARDDEALARTWKDLAWAVGVSGARPGEGLPLLRPAELAAANLRGPVATDVHMSLLGTRGNILVKQQDFAGAAAAFSAALTLARAEQWPGDTSRIRGYLASALLGQRRLGEAIAEMRQALAEAGALHGDQHPRVAHLHYNLALALKDSDDYMAARRHLDQAEAIFTAIHGSEHAKLAAVHELRAIIAADLGELEAAHRAHTRVRDIRQRVLPPEHPEQTVATYNLGAVAFELGRVDEARTLLRQALGDYERMSGATHPDAGMVLTLLGALSAQDGDPAGALRLLDRAVAILDRELPAVDPRRIDGHVHRAHALLSVHQPAAVLVALDGLLAAIAGGEVDAVRRLSLEYLRARALYDTGQRAQARRLISEVQAASASGEQFGGLRAEVQDWLSRAR